MNHFSQTTKMKPSATQVNSWNLKPDFIYYRNSLLPLKNFLYSPEKIPFPTTFQPQAPTKRVTLKYLFVFLRENNSDILGRMLTKHKISCTPYILEWQKFPLKGHDFWFCLPRELSKNKHKMNNFTLISWKKNNFHLKEKSFLYLSTCWKFSLLLFILALTSSNILLLPSIFYQVLLTGETRHTFQTQA